ncbi:MAG: PQQ-like beta-propeller repeat protein [Opitutaceae bacterium]|nr:PQQ-like beta-propeller repeat protein [Verrucomicrobiales bacterium]
MTTLPTEHRPRWMLLLVILAAGLGALGWALKGGQSSQQQQNIEVARAVLLTGVGVFLWAILFSRWPWRRRLKFFVGVVALLVLAGFLFRISGVSGDLVPIVEFRWKSRSTTLMTPAGLPPASTGATTKPQRLPGDYSQFLGSNRDGSVASVRLARDWKLDAPVLLWRQPIGGAWSGFAVVNDRAVTMEQQGDEELTVCYDLFTGKRIWAQADRARYGQSGSQNTIIAGEGPRTTPTIVGRHLYALGALGQLNCLELESGKIVWSTNIITSNGASVGDWGVSGSPLVIGDVVVVNPGGPNRSLAAYDRLTGENRWAGGNGGASYCSPVEMKIGGVAQAVIVNSGAVFGHDVKTGQVLWSFPWPAKFPNVSSPILIGGDRVLVSSGYGMGAALFQVKQAETWSATPLWKSIRLKSKFANLFSGDGFIYGLDDGILACLDAATGDQKWKDGRYGHGQMMWCDNLLVIMAESGDVVLVEPNPTGLKELTRFTALTDKTWNPAALAGDILLVRNDKEAACFRLPLVK